MQTGLLSLLVSVIQQYLGVREQHDRAGRVRWRMLVRGHQRDVVDVVVRLVVFADGDHDACLLMPVVGAVPLEMAFLEASTAGPSLELFCGRGCLGSTAGD
jgi:hypothetical protein